MLRLVVLGTGSGVGKTFASAALLRALAQHNVRSVGLKPIETGLGEHGATPPPDSDSALLEHAATEAPPRPHPLYGFRDPISPHLAARRANVQIDLAAITKWVHHNTLQHMPGTVAVIETAGGALSPVAPGITNLDLAVALAPALWLLVAPDALGVLHDLSATLCALRATARAPDYVLLSASRPPDASTGTNADELRRLGIADPVAVLAAGAPNGLEPLVDALLAARP